ncbi:hypothetical protein KJ359_002692 [Pestalotiopsis sp. 9143b]|nr:hypothetical protein KJ359_002692 [Pestalotiopsis sp. 9143b]
MSPSQDGTFHGFPRLPAELRLKTWRFAIHPRTVDIREKYLYHPDKRRYYLISSTPPPAILQACRESRSEALSSGRYAAAFANAEIGPRYIWIDFVHDTVRLGQFAVGVIGEGERAKIRKAIVVVQDVEIFLQFNLDDDMKKMGALRELDIVSEPPLWTWGRNFGWIQSTFTEEFGFQAGWEPPRIRIIESATGEEMVASNYLQKAAALRGRGNRGRRAAARRALEYWRSRSRTTGASSSSVWTGSLWIEATYDQH